MHSLHQHNEPLNGPMWGDFNNVITAIQNMEAQRRDVTCPCHGASECCVPDLNIVSFRPPEKVSNLTQTPSPTFMVVPDKQSRHSRCL